MAIDTKSIPQRRVSLARSWRIISTPRNILAQSGTAKERAQVRALLARFHPYSHLVERLGEPAKSMHDVAGVDVLLAPFVDIGWPSRFSNGSFGVYYAAGERETAIAETRFHRARLLAESEAPPALLPLAAFTATLNGQLHDLRGMRRVLPKVYDRDDYSTSQKLGRALNAHGSNGVAYESVRREGGQCFGIFRPSVLRACRRVQELYYRWDGSAIVEVLIGERPDP